MKKVFSGVLGLIFIAVVIYFGVKSYNQSDPNAMFTILFGLAGIFIGPLGISALGYSFSKKGDSDDVYEKLSKIPNIEKMIQEAETQEEINLKLKREKDNLINYIKAESSKLAAQERKLILENDAQRILKELKYVEMLLKSYSDLDSETDESVLELRDRIKSIVRRDNTISILGVEIEITNLRDVFNFPSNFLVKIIINFIERFVFTQLK